MLDDATRKRLNRLKIGADVFYLDTSNREAWAVVAGFRTEAIGKYYERVFVVLDNQTWTEIPLCDLQELAAVWAIIYFTS